MSISPHFSVLFHSFLVLLLVSAGRQSESLVCLFGSYSGSKDDCAEDPNGIGQMMMIMIVMMMVMIMSSRKNCVFEALNVLKNP